MLATDYIGADKICLTELFVVIFKQSPSKLLKGGDITKKKWDMAGNMSSQRSTAFKLTYLE